MALLQLSQIGVTSITRQQALLAVGVFLLGAFFYKIIYTLLLNPLRKIPGPFMARFTRLWEIRHIMRGGDPKVFVDLHEKHGAIVRVGPNSYSFNSPQDQKKIYTLKGDFIKSNFYHCAGDPYRPSIFSLSDEAEHSARKKRLANLYSMSSMVNYEDAVDRMNALLIRKFRSFTERGNAIHIPDFMQCYALDVIGEITANKNFGLMEKEGDIDNLINLIQMGNAYLGVIGLMPWFHKPVFHISKWFGLQNPGDAVEKFAIEIISEYSKHDLIEKENPRSDPMITKLFKLQAAGKAKKEDFTDAIGANMAAGSDTTAITLAAALYYLFRTPTALETLRREIDEMAADGKISNPVTFAEAQAMPYLQAVIMETLRMHPAVGCALPRVVPRGGVELAGQHFPEGTIVGTNAWAVHQNPDVFGEDAKEYKPERFLSDVASGGNNAARMGTSFAFGGGTRSCLGKNVSMLEMTKVLPQIIREFDIEFVDDKPWRIATSFFVWQHYHCYIKPRATA